LDFKKKEMLRKIALEILLIISLALGVILILFGIISIFSPSLIFSQIILPLACLFSKVGYIREIKTIEKLWQLWNIQGRYIVLFLGVSSFVFSIVLDNLSKEKKIYTEEKREDYLGQIPFKKNNTLFYVVTILIITIIAALLRIINLNQSLWLDELYTAYFVKNFRLWHYLELGDHWFYTFLSFIFVHIFGENEIVLRIPAYIIGLVTVPMIYYFAKNFFSDKNGLLSALFLCFCYFHIEYSNEARGYSALAFFSLFSSLIFLKIIIDRQQFKKTKELFLLTIITALGFLSHFYYIWVIFAQCLTVVFLFLMGKYFKMNKLTDADTITNLLLTMITGLFIGLFIYGPNFLFALFDKYTKWVSTGDPVSLNLFSYLLIGRIDFMLSLFFIFFMTVALGNMYIRKRVVIFLYFIFILIVPYIILMVICKRIFYRYIIYMLPFMIIILADGILVLVNFLKSKWKKFILFIFVITFIILQIPALRRYYFYRFSGRQDYRSVGKMIDNYADRGDFVYGIGGNAGWLQYYIKKHQLIYNFDREQLIHQIEEGKNNIWLVVSYPEYIISIPEDFMVYKIARLKLKLVGYFPARESAFIVYTNKPISIKYD